VPVPPPQEIVRLLVEAHAAADERRVLALVDPALVAETGGGRQVLGGADDVLAYLRRQRAGDSRTEVVAHRYECDGDDVVVHGRLRVLGRGSLSDSPASWRVTVRDGRVARIVAAEAATALRFVA
jgi:ketosteroid isomerase-like protein